MNTLAIACVAIAGGRQEIPGCLPRFDYRSMAEVLRQPHRGGIRGRDQRDNRLANVRLRRLIVRNRPLGSGSSTPGSNSDPRTGNRCRRTNLVASAAYCFSSRRAAYVRAPCADRAEPAERSYSPGSAVFADPPAPALFAWVDQSHSAAYCRRSRCLLLLDRT
jgi:hypothetical protein